MVDIRLCSLLLAVVVTAGCAEELEDCDYDASRVCYRCGGCADDPRRVHVGCRGKDDCALFCSTCMASDYTSCNREYDDRCEGWVEPRGPLEACTTHPSELGGLMHCCSFCSHAVPAGACGEASDGKQVQFCNSCMADGYRYVGGICGRTP